MRGIGARGALRPICVATAGVALAAATPPPPPVVTLSARETIDAWSNVSGGVQRGEVLLNKLQVGGTLNGDAVGLAGFRAHAQVFRTDGANLSARVGDIQTVSNIEAVETNRLFEAWLEQSFGKKDAGGASLRVGLIDLNSEFDAIDPASLFVDSSHGIAPDLSKSGRNGPSIFPVSSLAVRGEWTPSPRWALRAALFDGIPGDPDHPKALAAVRLRARDGALAIGQVDFKPAKDVKIAAGLWHYTGNFDRIDGSPVPKRGNTGAYGFIQGPVPGAENWSGWLRAGVADREAQIVSGYIGAGLVAKGIIGPREHDRLGIAVAHAVISPVAHRISRLPSAETTIEATYQAQFGSRFAVQPDIQYVIHPASAPGIGNALVFGLRFVFTANFPGHAAQSAAADPNAAPDGTDPPSP